MRVSSNELRIGTALAAVGVVVACAQSSHPVHLGGCPGGTIPCGKGCLVDTALCCNLTDQDDATGTYECPGAQVATCNPAGCGGSKYCCSDNGSFGSLDCTNGTVVCNQNCVTAGSQCCSLTDPSDCVTLVSSGSGSGGSSSGSGGNGDGGTCHATSPSGTLTFTYQGTTYSTSCFSGGVTQGNLTLGSPADYANGSVSGDINILAKNLDTQAPCTWQDGTTVPLTSGCVQIDFSYAGPDGAAPTWIASGGGAAENYTSVGAPVPTGSLTVVRYATGSGQTAEVSFSSDAALSYASGLNPANTGPATLIPVSGTAGILTQ